MGSLILNVNNRLLIKTVRHISNKNGPLQQCRCFSYKHVFPHRSSSYLFRRSKQFDFNQIAALRFASSINIVETKPKVESSDEILSQNAQANPSYSVENNSDQNFFIVRDKGKGGEEISNIGESEFQLDDKLPPIPEPPAVGDVWIGTGPKPIDPEVLAKLLETGAEPSLADLGLGFCWYSPTSYIRALLEYLHVSWDVPWWGSIVIAALVLRTVFLPFYLKTRKHMVNLSNTTAKFQEITAELNTAQMAGDNLKVAKITADMARNMGQMSVGKAMIPMIVQGCIFLPFFWALRSMANLPVESMKTGGALWFLDLTVPDQFYILPITTSATLGLMLWLGTESVKVKDVQSKIAKGVLVGLPVGLLLFSINFPSAVLCYWTATNFFSLGQGIITRIPAVKTYFEIPEIERRKKKKTEPDVNFIQNMKDSYRTRKLLQEVQHRDALNERQFLHAGKQPIARTFKRNPLLHPPKEK